MLLLVTCDEDGDIRLDFFGGPEELAASFTGDGHPPRWLTTAEAAGDPNYWPAGAAFLAEVTPARLEAEEVAVRWRLAK